MVKDSKTIHIVPINDVKKHTESRKCECDPDVEEYNGVIIIIHNSFDGREGVEMAKDILKQSR